MIHRDLEKRFGNRRIKEVSGHLTRFNGDRDLLVPWRCLHGFFKPLDGLIIIILNSVKPAAL